MSANVSQGLSRQQWRVVAAFGNKTKNQRTPWFVEFVIKTSELSFKMSFYKSVYNILKST